MAKRELKFVYVDASVLGFKKPVAVLESNRNHMLATEMQLVMAEMDAQQDTDDYRKMIELYHDSIKKEVEFLQKILKLDDAKADEVYDLDQEETVKLIVEILSKIMHIEPAEDEAEEKE